MNGFFLIASLYSAAVCDLPARIYIDTATIEQLAVDPDVIILFELGNSDCSIQVSFVAGTAQEYIIQTINSGIAGCHGAVADSIPDHADRIEVATMIDGDEATLSIVQHTFSTPLIHHDAAGGDGMFDLTTRGEDGLFADLNCDEAVDESDLGLLIDAWGSCENEHCAPDLNADGFVDVFDLFVMFLNWTR